MQNFRRNQRWSDVTSDSERSTFIRRVKSCKNSRNKIRGLRCRTPSTMTSQFQPSLEKRRMQLLTICNWLIKTLWQPDHISMMSMRSQNIEIQSCLLQLVETQVSAWSPSRRSSSSSYPTLQESTEVATWWRILSRSARLTTLQIW